MVVDHRVKGEEEEEEKEDDDDDDSVLDRACDPSAISIVYTTAHNHTERCEQFIFALTQRSTSKE